jgi:hypothetical protein
MFQELLLLLFAHKLLEVGAFDHWHRLVLVFLACSLLLERHLLGGLR